MKAFLCTLSLLTMTLPALAQSDTNPSVDSVADDSLWLLQVSHKRLFASNLGPILEDMIATTHRGKLDAFSEAIGFDIRTDIQEILLFGDKFDETSAKIIAQLGATSGNLEGWFLAAPGYQSEDLDENTILHSFIVEKKKNNPRLWCAIPYNQADKRYTLVATFDRDQTINLINQISKQGSTWPALTGSEGTFLSLRINDLSQIPMKIDSNELGAAVVKTIRSVEMQATAGPDTLIAKSSLTADSPARAEQLQQLITGLKAMVQLAAMQEDSHDNVASPPAFPASEPKGRHKHDNEDAKKAAELLNNLTVDHQSGSSTLTVSLKLGYDALVSLRNH